jgi:hypothetical protein
LLRFKRKKKRTRNLEFTKNAIFFALPFTHLTCQSARDGNNFLAMGVSKMEGGHLSWSKTSLHCMLKKRPNEFNIKDASKTTEFATLS